MEIDVNIELEGVKYWVEIDENLDIVLRDEWAPDSTPLSDFDHDFSNELYLVLRKLQTDLDDLREKVNSIEVTFNSNHKQLVEAKIGSALQESDFFTGLKNNFDDCFYYEDDGFLFEIKFYGATMKVITDETDDFSPTMACVIFDNRITLISTNRRTLECDVPEFFKSLSFEGPLTYKSGTLSLSYFMGGNLQVMGLEMER